MFYREKESARGMSNIKISLLDPNPSCMASTSKVSLSLSFFIGVFAVCDKSHLCPTSINRHHSTTLFYSVVALFRFIFSKHIAIVVDVGSISLVSISDKTEGIS